MANSTRPLLRVLPIASVLPSAVGLGYALALSNATAPLLHNIRPHVSLRIFVAFSNSSGLLMKTLPLVSTLASTYLAYSVPAQRRLWGAAAALVGLGTVLTASISGPAAKQLVAMEAGGQEAMDKLEQTREHEDLLARCVKGNYIRSVAYAMGSLVGMWAAS